MRLRERLRSRIGNRSRALPLSCFNWTLAAVPLDRKSTPLHSSHLVISYAVFCLKKKNLHAPQATRWSPAPTELTRVAPTVSAATPRHLQTAVDLPPLRPAPHAAPATGSALCCPR